MIIKINGPNYYQGSGDYFVSGYLGSGNGIGKGIRSQYLFCSSTGNGWGDGKGFGDGYYFGGGNGESYPSSYFKKGFLNHD